MKKLYLILLLTLAAVMLVLGIWSAVNIAPPAFAAENLLDGSYTTQLDDCYTENFLFRNFFLSVNRVLNRFYYFSAADNLLTIDYQGGAEHGGISLNESAEETTEQPAVEKPRVENPAEEDVTSVGTIIINGNRAMDIPTAENENIVLYGQTVSALAAAMPDGVRTFSLVTPNSGEFYSPTSFHTGIHDQKAMIDLCYGNMAENVTTVDAYSVISAHADEYLFFRTDHHWTQKGAYYAYTAFCEKAGFTAPPLDRYETGTYENFVGSMYNYTADYPQSKTLKEQPDTLTYYLPRVETNAAYYASGSLQNGRKIPVVDTALREEINNKYLCYISGDTPVCVIESSAQGGTCLVLKESYGNAFIPFLTEHYSKVIAIDPREFSGKDEPTLDIAAFAAEQQVDDLLVLNYPFMMSNAAYIGYLEALLP